MIKKYLKLVSILLLIIFSSSSISFAAVSQSDLSAMGISQADIQKFKSMSPAEIQKYRDMVNSQGAQDNKSVQNASDLSNNPNQDKNKLITPVPGDIPSSDIEIYFNYSLAGESSLEGFKPINQFGYAIFKSTASSFIPDNGAPVGPDYIVGPGDSFVITMWGISEGIFNVDVGRDGNIVLPKVGTVNVAGIRFGQLQTFVEQQLTKYYEKVNVSVSMKNIRTIRVYIVGEVQSPGSYMVSSLATLYGALFSAGGPTKKGTLRDIRLLRNNRVISHVDLYKFLLNGDRNQDVQLQSGDTIFVPIIGPVVGVAGNINRPAIYEIKGGDADLSDIIRISGGVLPTSYLNRVQVERIIAHQKKVIIDKQVSFSSSNPRFYISIQDMDLVKIYPIISSVSNAVFLEGAAKYPGRYELKENMKLKDIIPSVSSLSYGAYLPKAELIRVDKNDFKSEIFQIDLNKIFSGDESQNYKLQSGDRIVISSELKDQQKIVLSGEFKLPGEYTIIKGERLSSVIERAGGFSSDAYLFGAIFIRQSAKIAQQSSLQKLIDNLQNESLSAQSNLQSNITLSDDQISKKINIIQQNAQMLEKLKESINIQGRVIIKLNSFEKLKGSVDDLVLEDGDKLFIPKTPNTVNILGEVYTPTSVAYEEGKNVAFYLNKVGGVTRNGDRGSIYIIRADGSTVSKDQGYNIIATQLNPGDSILVPQYIDKYDFFVNVKDFTQWLFQVTLATAVVIAALRR